MAVTGFGRPVIRLLIGLIVMGSVLTFFGLKDVVQDMGASHRDFSGMTLDDFHEGDIVYGNITDTIGCFMYHYEKKKTDKIVDQYYAIPFYNSPSDATPTKVILYKTGNSDQMKKLAALQDEVFEYYCGGPAPSTVVRVERAEIVRLENDERSYYNELIDEFVDAVYSSSYNSSQRTEIKNMYKRATVPYVVQFHAKTAIFVLPLGLGILGVAILIIVLIIGPWRGRNRSTLSYVPPTTVSGDMYRSSQTGSPVSGSGTYSGGIPQQSGSSTFSAGSSGSGSQINRGMPAQMQQIYSQGRTGGAPPAQSGQGMPSQLQSIYSQRQPSQGAVGQGLSPEAQRILSYQKKPDYSAPTKQPMGIFGMRQEKSTAQEMQKILNYERTSGRSSVQPPIPTARRRGPDENFFGKKNYSDMERPLPPLEGEQGAENNWQTRGMGQANIYGSSVPPFVPPGRNQSKGDSMPSVDPHSEQHIDLSNGGIALEERSSMKAQMPMNGDLPVINPESADSAFDREIGAQLPEMPKAPEMPKVSAADENMQIKPLELKDRYSTDQFRVEPSEDYQHLQKYVEAGSGQMQSVDPYTEKNVDLSNGGRELPDEPPVKPAPAPAPIPAPAPAAQPAPAHVSLEKAAAVPEVPAAAQPAPAPVKPEKPAAPENPATPAPQPAPAHVSLEKAPEIAEVPQIADSPVTFAEIPKVQEVQASFTEIPKVQDIPTVQSVPTVQDVPKASDFPTVPDYSSSYARPEFPTAPTFPDKIETPEFPKAPDFPEKDDNGNYTF